MSAQLICDHNVSVRIFGHELTQVYVCLVAVHSLIFMLFRSPILSAYSFVSLVIVSLFVFLLVYLL